MACIRVFACLCIMFVFQLTFASTSTTDEGGSASVDRMTFERLIKVASSPMDNMSFLQLLRAEKRCNDYNFALAGYSCRDWLLSALASLGQPSDALLVESLNWYWSGKHRASADEVMQNRLFNQLQLPLFDAILMEKRYLRSVVEYRDIQYRINPSAREQWSMFPTGKNNQSIMEFFLLTYDLPANDSAYARGYIHQDRKFSSVTRMLDSRTELNRLIGHILGFVGKNPPLFLRNKTPKIPDNPDFWETLRAFEHIYVNSGYRGEWLSTPVENRLRQLSVLYGQWLQLTPRVNDLARVGVDKVFIEYIYYKNNKTGLGHYAAFTVSSTRPTEIIHFSDLGPASSINQLVANLRRGILQKTPIVKQQQQLADLLIKPLSINFKKTAEIVISPTGTLGRLPFSLLVQAESSANISISYSDSWSILIQKFWRQAHLNPQIATTPGIILANPDYGGDLKTVPADLSVVGLERKGDSAWPRFFMPLAYTGQEGKTIEALSPDEVIFLSGNRASEFALFERNNPKFIHIASHGYFLSDDWQRRDTWPHNSRPWGSPRLYGWSPKVLPRLNSGLALAGANQLIAGTVVKPFRQDGLFTAADAASLNLLGTELVVLSACDTGLGEVTENQSRGGSVGDGVSDLRTAFRQAGAKNVIMSLWPVADKTTWWFMEEFYQAWFSGISPKKALGLAKNRLRERLRKNAMPDDPYYWAGFVIQSDF